VFPKDMNLGEDMISHDLFHHAFQSVYLAQEYYFYYQREGSLLRTNNVSSRIKSQYQYSQNAYGRYLFVKKHPQYHSMLQTIKERSMVEGVITIRNMVSYLQYASHDHFQLQVNRLRTIPLSGKDVLSFGFKFDIFLLKIHPTLYKTIRKFYVYVTRMKRLSIKNAVLSKIVI
jgi:hypothetical protein